MTLPALRKTVQDVLDNYGIRAPLDISIGAKGIGYSEGGLLYEGTRAYVLINPDEQNMWNALHEAAHIVCDHKGMDSFDGDHGPSRPARGKGCEAPSYQARLSGSSGSTAHPAKETLS